MATWPGMPLGAYVRRLDVDDWRLRRRDTPRDIGQLLAIVEAEEGAGSIDAYTASLGESQAKDC